MSIYIVRFPLGIAIPEAFFQSRCSV